MCLNVAWRSRPMLLAVAGLLMCSLSAEAQRRPARATRTAEEEPAAAVAEPPANTLEINPFAPGPPATEADVFAEEPSPLPTFGGERKSRVTACWPMVALPGHDEERRLVAALDKSGDFVFYEVPLEEALIYLQELFDVRFLLDTKAAEQVGVNRMTEVTLERKNLSLRTGLTHLLESLELTFIVREDAIHVTTQTAVTARPARRVYDLSGHQMLVDNNSEPLVSAVNEALLIEDVLLVPLQDQLIVVGDEQVHYEVARLLALLNARQ